MKKKKARKSQKKKRPQNTNNIHRWPSVDWDGVVTFSVATGIATGLLLLRDVPVVGALAVGIFVALAMLPYFDAKKWKPRPILLALIGAVYGSSFGVYISATIETVILLGVAGLMLGFFAHTWVRHL